MDRGDPGLDGRWNPASELLSPVIGEVLTQRRRSRTDFVGFHHTGPMPDRTRVGDRPYQTSPTP